MTKTILIAGGSGLIGRALSAHLINHGYVVHVLSRNPKKDQIGSRYFKWDLDQGYIDSLAFDQVSGLINLTGAPIADKPWTKAYKKQILSSRIESNTLLSTYVSALPQMMDFMICASATGIYGDRGDEDLTVSSIKGQGFVSDLVESWEESSRFLSSWTKRLSILRIGLVLSNDGGILNQLKFPANLGLAPYFGKGQQWLSWVHIMDFERLVKYIIDNEIHGTFNAVSPNPIRYKEAVAQLARSRRGYALKLPVPEWALKTLLPKRSEIVLMGNRVFPSEIRKKKFSFKYKTFMEAINNLYPSN